jgi:hypothetical protein
MLQLKLIDIFVKHLALLARERGRQRQVSLDGALSILFDLALGVLE